MLTSTQQLNYVFEHKYENTILSIINDVSSPTTIDHEQSDYTTIMFITNYIFNFVFYADASAYIDLAVYL